MPLSFPGPISRSSKVPEVSSADVRWSSVSPAIIPNIAEASAFTGSTVCPSTVNEVGSVPTNCGVWLTLSPL